MEKGYLANGQEVMIVKKFEEGYLIRKIFNSEEGEIEEEIEFVSKVYDSPPTEKLATDVSKLRMEKYALQSQIDELRKIRLEEQALLHKANNIPNFQMIVEYFNGDFEWILTDRNSICKASSVFNSRNVCIELLKGELRLYTLDYDHFGSNKHWVTIFKTKEDAITEQQKRVMAMINECNHCRTLEDIAKSFPLDTMQDPEIKALYENKKTELANKAKADTIGNAKKEIAKYTKVLEENS